MFRLAHVAFAYDERPVLTDVTVHLESGWTALVGANGAGKTTLMRLMAGQLTPTSGAVHGAPGHLCPQRVESLDEATQAFGWDWSPEACRWRGRLDLDPDDLERWPTMSPGERKRWQVGAALAAEPPVLLLDEPTNHLDADGRQRLLDALHGYRGVGVVISHDRAFLDALTTSTVWLEGGHARHWPVPIREAEHQRSLERDAAWSDVESAQAEVRKARRELARTRQNLGKAERQMSAKNRMRNAGDNEARGMGAKFIAAKGQARQARQVATVRARAERLQDVEHDLDKPTELGRSVFVDYQPPRRSTLMEVVGRTLLAGERTLLERVDVTLRRDDRVHLAGPNGAGKTTLLTALLASSTLPEDRLLFVPQELDRDAAATLLTTLHALEPDVRNRVLHCVAALGLAPPVLLQATHPSPGEARKLAIALGLARHAWAIVLDEPTNHLDLPSIGRLRDALVAYPGALLLVTHDADLAAATTTRRWELRDGRLTPA